MKRNETIEAVQRMQDYIDDHIRSPITLRDLANAAGYSPWYSARIFKDTVGMTAFEYIRALRLNHAAVRLLDAPSKIVDVAFDYVFDSHEGFTRAFTKHFGRSPTRYRNDPNPLPLFMPHRIRDHYIMLQKGEWSMSEKHQVEPVFVQVIERPARKLILKRGIKAIHYFEYCEEVGCDVWGILSGIKEALYEPAGMWLPESLIRPGTSSYIQGVEVASDYKGEVPDGYEIIDLSPCKMMVFQGAPYDDAKFEAAIESLWNVMKKYDPHIYGYEWADDEAPRFQLEPQGYRGYIEARPVKPLNQA